MPEPMRQLGRHVAFPLVLGGSLTAAIVLMPVLGTAGAVVAAETGAVLAIVLLERALPFRPAWNRSHGDLRTDAIHATVSGIGTAQVLQPAAKLAGGVAAAWLAGAVGMPVWPAGWPLLAQLVLALLVAELAQYWWHRLEHEVAALWRFHAVHHSAQRLYWLNAARFHPIDLGVLTLVGYLPLVALGCPEDVVLLFAFFDAVFGMLQHCNVDVRLGPLNRVFSMAEPHRWHHSRALAEANSNYGSNLLVWDVVFGTAFLPHERAAPAAIGIGDMPAFPAGYLRQLASPFRWRRVQRESRGVVRAAAAAPGPA